MRKTTFNRWVIRCQGELARDSLKNICKRGARPVVVGLNTKAGGLHATAVDDQVRFVGRGNGHCEDGEMAET